MVARTLYQPSVTSSCICSSPPACVLRISSVCRCHIEISVASLGAHILRNVARTDLQDVREVLLPLHWHLAEQRYRVKGMAPRWLQLSSERGKLSERGHLAGQRWPLGAAPLRRTGSWP